MYNPADFTLKGQVAIVTGAGAGIGRAIAETFAAAGAAVVVSDLQQSTAEAVVQAITRAGGRAVSIPCDVTQEQHLETLVQESVKHFGKLTILVSNAGGGLSRSICRWQTFGARLI